jgi:hypothetical protein
LTVSLPICIPFISSSCLTALARNSSTMLNRSGDSGHRCLISDFRVNGFSFSPLSMMLSIGLSYTEFTMLSYILCIPTFLELLSWSGVGSYQKLFLNLLRWSNGFVFASINVLYYIYKFVMSNHPCSPGMKLTLTWWMIFLICCWI